MSGAGRRPEEVCVVVCRPGPGAGETLVLLRAPEKQGYWHLVAGGVEWGEEPAAAAARELAEETGLRAPVRALPVELSYDLAGDPEAVRARFAPGTTTIRVHPFAADAPEGWEPILDHEHVDHAWLAPLAAEERLFYPEPRLAVRVAFAGGSA